MLQACFEKNYFQRDIIGRSWLDLLRLIERRKIICFIFTHVDPDRNAIQSTWAPIWNSVLVQELRWAHTTHPSSAMATRIGELGDSRLVQLPRTLAYLSLTKAHRWMRGHYWPFGYPCAFFLRPMDKIS